MLRILLLFLVSCPVMLSGCGGSSSPSQQFRSFSSMSAPQIIKGAIYGQYAESTPVIWNNELLYISDMPDDRARTVITRQSDKSVLFDQVTGLNFISAIVSNGTLYIFGVDSAAAHIQMISTTDLINWTAPVIVFTGANIFNNSVSADSTGFIMAYEVCEPNTVCFNAKFLHSTDLVSWSPIGGTYEAGYYTACPTIRYVNGYYYLLYLSAQPIAGGQFAYSTNLSRSTDLNAWTQSPITVLSPNDDAPSNNTSDMDLVEFNGVTHIIYLNNSQIGQSVPNTGLREAMYNGTLAQFVGLFY